MGTWGRVIGVLVVITLGVGAVQGVIMELPVDTPGPENGPEYPPGANSYGINDYEELLANHDDVWLAQNAIQTLYRYEYNMTMTTKVDRDEQQYLSRTEDGDPVDDVIYYVNGSDIGGDDYGLEYKRIGYSEEDYRTVGYNVAGYNSPELLVGSNSDHYRYVLRHSEWRFVNQTTVSTDTHLTTYRYDGLDSDTDPDDFEKTIDTATITIRNDGLITEYYERGNTSTGPYEKRVTVEVTDADLVTEPSWLDTAIREDNEKEWDWFACGEDDIDGDGDGLCNEW